MDQKEKWEETSQGECPNCGAHGVFDYGKFKFVDDMGFFPFRCRECGQEGREWYHLRFIELTEE